MNSPLNTNLQLTKKIGTSVLLGFLVAAVLLVLPLSDQPIIDTKSLLIFLFTLVVLILLVVKNWQRQLVSLVVSPLSIPLLLFGGAVLASSFFTGEYPVEHLLGNGGVYFSFVLLGLFGASVVGKKSLKSWLMPGMAVTAVLLAVVSILQTFGFGPSLLLNAVYPIDFPNNGLFNVAGSSLVAAQIFGVLTIGFVTALVSDRKLPLAGQVGLVASVAGLLLTVWTLLPGKQAAPTLLPHAASWSVSIDTLRTPRTALIGFGPEAFNNAYNIFKPNWLNGTELWNIQFSQASNTPFTLLVTTGLFGLLSWLAIYGVIISQTKKIRKSTMPVHAMLIGLFLIQFFFPATAVTIVLQAVLLIAWIALEKSRLGEVEVYGLTIRKIKSRGIVEPVSNTQRFFMYGFSLILILFIGFASFGIGRTYMAHALTVQSIAAAQENDAVGVYDAQRRAVALNPYLDDFRRRYSATNLAIATAIAQQAEPTEQDTQQFSQLVQQAIREARAATLLDPSDTNNWTNLAQIYRSLIGAAESADQWAVDSYVSAIQTNPQNPVLRVELGGIFFGAENYAQSAQFFQQAIDLKPDYANAYYNLANSFRELGQLENARVSYQNTLQLVPADSEAYVQASQELAAVEELIEAQPEGETAAGSQQQGQAAGTQPAFDATQQLLESPLDTVSQPAADDLNLGDINSAPAPEATSGASSLEN